MLFQVLGPVEVLDCHGGRIAIPAGKQRQALAMLLLHAGDGVSAERFIDGLWAGEPPPSAQGNLKTYVWSLRRALGPADRITHDGTAYRLRLACGELDSARFEDLVAEGRRAEPERAVAVLTEALALWRGVPFDGVDGCAADAVRTRLCELRLAAEEHRGRALVALGRCDDAVAAVRGLVAEHPFHEHLRAVLMTALHGAGRSAEALAVFDDGRAVLDRDLGLLPGTELRRLHAAILNHDATLEPARPAPVIAQLPAAPHGLVGRDDLLRALGERRLGPDVHVLTGAAGVGKTAAALAWAHANRSRFPDGQLHVTLRGHSAAPPLTARQALEELLQSLDVDPSRRPVHEDAAASAYRSAVADRRLLVLLDDAADAAQVRPLLPGGPGCAVLVTSRNRLDGLVARDGARQHRVGTLGPDDGRAVLGEIAGRARIAAEPEAAADLVALCGGLPLALRVAAAHLAAEPDRSVADYAAELRAGDRIAVLSLPGDPGAVGAAIDLSYRLLPPPTRRVLRLIGLLPGPDTTAPAVAALAELDEARAERELRALASANLLERPAPGRYAPHELVRAYAAAKARADGPGPLERLLAWYDRAVDVAADALHPGRVRLPGSVEHRGATPPPDASAWFAAEARSIAAVVDLAAATGRHRLAWQVADGCRAYLTRGSTAWWEAIASAGRRAAQADGNDAAVCAMDNSAGLLDLMRGENSAAAEHLHNALTRATACGWTPARVVALTNLGLLHHYTGTLEAARGHLTEALAAAAADPRCSVHTGTVLINLGMTALHAGHSAAATTHLTAAAAGGGRTAALALAELHLHLGRPDDAAAVLAPLTPSTVSYEAALALRLQAATVAARGDTDRAAALLTEAIAAGNDHHYVSVDTRNALASTDTARSRLDAAEAGHRAALADADRSQYRRGRVEALLGLADIHGRRGHLTSAAETAAAALALAGATGHRHQEARAAKALADFERQVCS